MSPPELLTYKEAAEELGVTPRHVRRLVRRRDLPALVAGRHANGKVRYGIPRQTLIHPPITRIAQSTDDKRTSVVPSAESAESADDALAVSDLPTHVPLTRDGAPDVAAMHAMGLQSYVREWDRRMAAVARYLALKRSASFGEKTAVAERVASEFGRSIGTIYQWVKDHRDGGPAALVPRWTKGNGRPALPLGLQLQIREYWLNSRRTTVAQVYDDIVVPWYRDRAERPPHYRNVCRWIRRHILPLEEVYWREGHRTYEADMAPKVVRDLPGRPNQVWCADHRLWDVQVLVADGKGAGWSKYDRRPCPCGSGKERCGCCSLRRPWVTLIADVCSAAFVGWRIGLTPTAAGVCHAIRSAILTFGVPEHWLRDNGKEFAASRLGGDAARCRRPRRRDLQGHRRWPCALPEDVEGSGVWAQLGVGVTTSLPFHAWSKPIEAFFGAFSRQWENKVPGWTGRDAKEKPEQLDTQIKNGALLSWDEFRRIFAEQAAKWNAEHVCGERTAAPFPTYKVHMQQGWEPRRADPDTLALLLQDRRKAVVETNGIKLQAGGQTYRYFSELLSLYVGCRVDVRWDPEDPAQIYAYPPGGDVLALPLADNAQWGAWGEPNKQARRGAKVQRDYLRARAEEHLGSTPLERLDPTGAVRMIRERQVRVAASDARVTQADSQLAELAEAQQRAALAPTRKAGRPQTVYDDLLRGIA